MNPTDATRQRQAGLNGNAVDDSDEEPFPPVPYSDPRWFDPDHWVLGPAIPRDATFYFAGRALKQPAPNGRQRALRHE